MNTTHESAMDRGVIGWPLAFALITTLAIGLVAARAWIAGEPTRPVAAPKTDLISIYLDTVTEGGGRLPSDAEVSRLTPDDPAAAVVRAERERVVEQLRQSPGISVPRWAACRVRGDAMQTVLPGIDVLLVVREEVSMVPLKGGGSTLDQRVVTTCLCLKDGRVVLRLANEVSLENRMEGFADLLAKLGTTVPDLAAARRVQRAWCQMALWPWEATPPIRLADGWFFFEHRMAGTPGADDPTGATTSPGLGYRLTTAADGRVLRGQWEVIERSVLDAATHAPGAPAAPTTTAPAGAR